MNILLTNDDGIHAKGLLVLKNKLKLKHNIFVCAPDDQRSATSHSMTLGNPIRIKEIYIDNERCYSCSGFPADCVFLGVLELFKHIKIDLVVSGINLGANLGFDISYSGTVGAAKEGLSYGIPSVATSITTHDKNANFSVAADYTVDIIHKLFENNIQKNCIYNINVPNLPKEEIKGIKCTNMSGVRYDSKIDKRTDPFNEDYYFITGELFDEHPINSDSHSVKENYVSVTPLSMDFTDYTELDRLKSIL